eukprot:jgi/Ulvmu1/5684/UM024_0031.1
MNPGDAMQPEGGKGPSRGTFMASDAAASPAAPPPSPQRPPPPPPPLPPGLPVLLPHRRPPPSRPGADYSLDDVTFARPHPPDDEPASIMHVKTPEGFQEALEQGARDIEVRAHLDLTELERPENTQLRRCLAPNIVDTAQRDLLRSHVAYVGEATRSIRGRCDGPIPKDLQLKWATHMHGTLPPLKPHQCLLLVASKALFAQGGSPTSLWISNLYLASLDSKLGTARQNLVLSTGYRDAAVRLAFDPDFQPGDIACSGPHDIQIYMSDVVVQGRPDSGSETLLLAPPNFETSVSFLARDSAFVGMSGFRPPFLVTRFATAAFSNCLFKDIHVQGHELFDVSNGGRVSLTDCKFANVTAGRDGATLADTSYNDPAAFGDLDQDPYSPGFCDGAWLYDFQGPDFELLPPRPEDTDALGANGWVQNQTVTDDAEIVSSRDDACSTFIPGRVPVDLTTTDPWLEALMEKLGPLPSSRNESEQAEHFYRGLPRCRTCTAAAAAAEQAPAAATASAFVPVPPIQATPDTGRTSARTEAAPRAPADHASSSAAHGWRTAGGILAAVAGAVALIVLAMLLLRRRRGGHAVLFKSDSVKKRYSASEGRPGPGDACVIAMAPALPYTSIHSTHQVMSTWALSTESSGVDDPSNTMFKFRLPEGLSLLAPAETGAVEGAGSDGVISSRRRAPAGPPSSIVAPNSVAGISRPRLFQPDSSLSRLVRAALASSGAARTRNAAATNAASAQTAGQRQAGSPQASPLVSLPESDIPDSHSPARRGGGDVQSTAQHAFSPISEARHPAWSAPAPAKTRAANRRRLARGHLSNTEESEAEGSAIAAAAAAPASVAAYLAPAQIFDGGAAAAPAGRGAVHSVRLLHRQLDRFMPSDHFLGKYELLGRWERGQGGQAVVQFARDDVSGVDYAIKFFLDLAAFRAEAAVYETCMPAFTTIYKRATSSHPRPPPSARRSGQSATNMAPSHAAPIMSSSLQNRCSMSTLTATASHSGAGTLNVVTAAYSIGSNALASFGRRSNDSRSSTSDAVSVAPYASEVPRSGLELIKEGSACTSTPPPRPRSSRRLATLPLGLVILAGGSEDSRTLPVTQPESPDRPDHPPASFSAAADASVGDHSAAKKTPVATKSSVQEADGQSVLPFVEKQQACVWDATPPENATDDASLYEGVETDGSGSDNDAEPACMASTVDGSQLGAAAAEAKRRGKAARCLAGAAVTEHPQGSAAWVSDCSSPRLRPPPALPRRDGGGVGGPLPGRSPFPAAVRDVDMQERQGAGDVEAAQAGAAIPAAAARFLPRVEAMCEAGAAELVDPRGRPLPPCIVMEKGESLHDWSERAEPDLFASVGVLSNVAKRLADMHEVGLVHRDLKPANVMWLPRENRWTVIDFGSATQAGRPASLSFTLAYAAPEVVAVMEGGGRHMEVATAVDAWSLGVMAFELLTGSPAFRFLTDGRDKVVAQLLGVLPLPWEGELGQEVKDRLGIFREPVLRLLHRDPAQRASMQHFCDLCQSMATGTLGNGNVKRHRSEIQPG